MTDKKDYLSRQLVQLLNAKEATQTQLAKFAGISQGLVANHIQQRAYPGLETLLKYAQFFRVSLYELTGIESLKDAEKGMAEQKDNPDPEALAMWEAYQALPDGPEKAFIRAKLKGNGDKKSQLFELMGGEARLRYVVHGDEFAMFAAYVMKEGTSTMRDGGIPEVMVTGPQGEDLSYLHKSSGRYYLEVSAANCSWGVYVEEKR